MRKPRGLSRRELLWRAGGLLALGAAGGFSAGGGRQAVAEAAGAATPVPVKGGILKVATIGDPPSVDMHQTTATITEQVTHEIYETLFAIDANWMPQPLLASGAQWSNGYLTLTIPLRTDVVFHNGAQMTAADVAASLQRWLRLSALGQTIQPEVKAVTAKDTHTVVIELTRPVGSLLSSLGNPNNMAAIIPKSIIDVYGDKPISAPVGTGPYKFQAWKPDAYLKVVRFDQYRPVLTPASGYTGRRVAYFDEIDFLPVPEANTRVAGLQSALYDFAIRIPQDQYSQITGNANLMPLIPKPFSWATFVFNKKKGLFANLKARQAFLKALDNTPLAEAAFGPKEFWTLDSPTIAYGVFADNATGARVFNHQDVAGAKALLKEAGYDGKPFLFMTTKEYDYQYRSALVAKEQLEAVGFKINFQVIDWATLVQRRNNPDLYDVFTTGFVFSPADPTAMDIFVSAKWPGWWVSDKKEAALRRFTETVAVSERKAAWSQIQALFYEEIPAIKIGDYFALNVAQRRLQGIQNWPTPFFWNVWSTKH